MVKRPHDNAVIGFPRILLPDTFIGIERAVKIFSIKPSAYHHNCRCNVFQVGEDIPLLPELIIVGVIHNLLPVEVVFVIFLYIFQRTQFHMKLVTVFGVFTDHLVIIPGVGCRAVMLFAKNGKGKQIGLG
ncbi:hypothetical protein D9M69_690680 [compost metagenome]